MKNHSNSNRITPASPGTRPDDEQPSPAQFPMDSFDSLTNEAEVDSRPLEVLVACLDATCETWDPSARQWVTESDGPTQVAAANTILARTVGLPPKRPCIVTEVEGWEPDLLHEADYLEMVDLAAASGVTLTQLAAAKKAMLLTLGENPQPPVSEIELVAWARRMHGLAGNS